ncbi:MAG: SusD/RagB family nutrient-binding outer membrane lipoprotein [bacterium]|nr:SusD/RagB family nutrient-binding outer membrane lipoprotein [bacterium]
MKNYRLIAPLALLLMAGCSKDFLESPEVQKDPNRATEVTADQLFNGIQVKTYFLQEGSLSRTLGIWMQSLAGTDRQTGSLSEYEIVETDLADEMEEVFIQGGLVDIKELRSKTQAAGNRVYAGIAKFHEAFNIGMAASLWGDFPYSEACSDVETPKLDRQSDIYASLQALLDEAIADLESGEKGTTLASSPVNDVNYGGDARKWAAACHSPKARLYMHWAEVDPANYSRAEAEAALGIASPADNYQAKHTASLNEEFGYYTYQNQRDSYIRAGSHMVELLKADNDPRLALYFDRDGAGQYTGAAPGERNVNASMLSAAVFLNPAHSFDLLTWEETRLIQAECAFKTGDESGAAALLNEVRRGIETRWGFDAGALGDASGLTGDGLFDAVMNEKYIALFLNIEVYNDWKRTARPVLVPYGGGNPVNRIPHRIYYSNDERNANPNIPVPSAQPLRNENDPL